jgi:hypothetical protein
MDPISGLYMDFNTADAAVRQLEQAGFEREKISVLARNEIVDQSLGTEAVQAQDVASGAAKGAAAGGVTGGLIGLLAAVGSLTIPGIGPVLAAGSLAATLGLTAGGAGVGAAVGGILGAMTTLNIPREDAEVFAEGVRRGGILVIVDASQEQEAGARRILEETGAVDVNTLRQELQASDWSRWEHDPDDDEPVQPEP